jgi:hypothetical protein
MPLAQLSHRNSINIIFSFSLKVREYYASFFNSKKHLPPSSVSNVAVLVAAFAVDQAPPNEEMVN